LLNLLKTQLILVIIAFVIVTLDDMIVVCGGWWQELLEKGEVGGLEGKRLLCRVGYVQEGLVGSGNSLFCGHFRYPWYP
jgi:hypothetical protein